MEGLAEREEVGDMCALQDDGDEITDEDVVGENHLCCYFMGFFF